VAGLTTAEIARATFTKEATVGQRVFRAKRALATAGTSFDVPVGPEREARLGDVLGVVYLLFNEGYAATAGSDWTRPELCREATRLARMLAALVPDDPEVLALQALLELQSSRLAARRDAAGRPVLLEQQDRGRWDLLLVTRGLRALEAARALGKPVGSYFLQASIAACHARARDAADTDWPQIAGWYDLLAHHAPGPVVEVNRALAHGRAFGPDQGLAVLDRVPVAGLAGSALLDTVRGDLLERAGRPDEAAAAFRRAAAATGNDGERSLLLGRAEEALPRGRP
jgi:predicted RNA polymerase sigma factor